MIDLNVKPKTIELQEKNLWNLQLGKDFSDIIHFSQSIKEKIINWTPFEFKPSAL